ncbi:GntR family transcriptional regulator [Tessaracoccus rhinocerotis]|uniref:GntR family transcriptional regulator n=1 Tax=Tessaracoccus rhinocerotis TaxID=1689449 RepID=A0A553JWA9_9ACTN|nr:GntR family transcriptional regulator [Tessaracoccus rhinocerotis]TRY16722.1 GntR family transcriptional regulator [Tessaracoccus rhinocerotis]
MLIRIDTSSEEPVFAQLAGSIRTEIALGRLAVGEKLPSAKEVAGSLDVNLHTVLRAYQELRDEGLIDIRRGRGAVVTEAAVAATELHDEVRALVQRAAALGISRATVAGLVRDVNTEGEDVVR